uniref:integrase core domain-containing protein n=1 Tax=Burkholderia gladioli TaxID=28095 RepID=UPI001FC8E2D5
CFSTATICSIEKRLRFMANHLLVQGQVCRKTRSRIGPGFLTQITARVIEVLSQLVSPHGAPRYLRSNNGPEFVSRAILKWAAQNGMDMVLSDPGKPWQNGADESFNGKFRDECLSLEWFRTRTEAKVVIEQWRRHYNAIRPHSSLAYLAPNECKQRYCSTEATEAVLQD